MPDSIRPCYDSPYMHTWVPTDADTSEERIAHSSMLRVLSRLIREGQISVDDSVLSIFSGEFDRAVLNRAGFRNVVFSNLASSVDADNRFDASRIPYPASSFDYVIAHAGIHHSSHPHEVVCEMYRVAEKAAIFFEAQDSWLMRLAVRLGTTTDYEWTSILDHGMVRGGVDDLPVPNYVYRWTRREVLKLVRSLDAAHVPDVRFFVEWDFTYRRIVRRLQRSPFRVLPVVFLGTGCAVAVKIANLLFGRFGNMFAAVIRKSNVSQPWIRDGVFVVPNGILVEEREPVSREKS